MFGAICTPLCTDRRILSAAAQPRTDGFYVVKWSTARFGTDEVVSLTLPLCWRAIISAPHDFECGAQHLLWPTLVRGCAGPWHEGGEQGLFQACRYHLHVSVLCQTPFARCLSTCSPQPGGGSLPQGRVRLHSCPTRAGGFRVPAAIVYSPAAAPALRKNLRRDGCHAVCCSSCPVGAWRLSRRTAAPVPPKASRGCCGARCVAGRSSVTQPRAHMEPPTADPSRSRGTPSMGCLSAGGIPRPRRPDSCTRDALPAHSLRGLSRYALDGANILAEWSTVPEEHPLMRTIAVSMQLSLSSSRPGANDVLEACRHVTGRPEEDNAHECALPPRPYAFIVRPGPFAPCARPVTCLLSWREVRGTLKGLPPPPSLPY
jgi:hypothetical protein